ncbi:DUF2510 domain-containing protein [Leucobacter allii]|uniref:DUF2510 domain-containing protein n=1 Tax=Leucobacter allii TaxID=2932247 RepID=UPI001FD5752D|nr:DUF2510 domain-containing protein [Leucobacter allii]UOR02088.1 DUF2510 domain-containing protein [Leucobacter allii]
MDANQVQPQQTPAGWYPNQFGQMQWWDGTQWGVVAQPVIVQSPPRRPTGRGFAITALVAAIIAAPIGIFSLAIDHPLPILTLGFFPVLFGVVFGILGFHYAKTSRNSVTLATVALVISAASAVIPISATII